MVVSNFPGTATDDGGGSWSWVNVSNVTSNDTGNASAGGNDFLPTNYIKTVGYGFNLPSTAVITGIRFTMYRHGSQKDEGSTRFAYDNSIKLMKAGVEVGNNKASSDHWDNTQYIIYNYGGDGDLWGTTWTYSDINDANFGVRIRIMIDEESGLGTTSADIDWMCVYVYYETSPGAPMNIYKTQGFQ